MPKAAYRFVGTESHVRDTDPEIKLNRYGQLFEMDQKLAEAKIAEGFLALPAKTFDGAGHSDEELKLYGADPAMRHVDAPPEFLAKKKTVLEALHQLREQLSEVTTNGD